MPVGRDGGRVVAQIERLLSAWFEEIFCDVFGTLMLGPAYGYAMLEALSAEEGLKVFRREKPDLVLVDLMMEEVDAGTSFIKELKARYDKEGIEISWPVRKVHYGDREVLSSFKKKTKKK